MDASYKTYSGSLLDPWPYVIPKSDLVEQTIKLDISRKIAATARCPNCTENSVKLGDTAGVLPSLGTALPLEPSKYPSNLADYLDCLGATYCVGRFDCRLADHKQQTAVLTSFAQNSDIPLRLELVLSETKSAETELREVANTLGYHGISPSAVIVTKASDMKSFQPGDPRPSGPSYAEMANAARKTFPNAQIGGGMVAFFTELNRLPVQHGLFDFVTHAVCPAVHAADDQSLMENLESAKWIFASARAMIGKTQYHLGPSWISTRVNPYGLGVFSNHLNERNCLADHDPRQCGLFGAAWALGLLASSANAGLDAVALASLTGPQGLAIGPDDRTPPGHPTAKVTPAFHVLRGLAAHGSCRVLATTVAEPESIAALGLASSVGPELWLANLTNTAQDIRIDGWQGQPSMLAMDHTNYEDAIQPKFLDLPRTKLNSVTSLRLAPYAIVRLSSGID
jgi:D-apionolactonase